MTSSIAFWWLANRSVALTFGDLAESGRKTIRYSTGYRLPASDAGQPARHGSERAREMYERRYPRLWRPLAMASRLRPARIWRASGPSLQDRFRCRDQMQRRKGAACVLACAQSFVGLAASLERQAGSGNSSNGASSPGSAARIASPPPACHKQRQN